MVLSRLFGPHIVIIIWLLLCCGMNNGNEADIFCLRSIKESLEDPHGYLQSSWNFNNKTEGYICHFTGVECWKDDENRVLNLKLSNMGLKGQFPLALLNCSSLTGLDLSLNKLSGTIPADISVLLFVTYLDLSSNNFSGQIPVGLANCTYLHTLKLDQNQLTGQIPQQLGQLQRLTSFTVTNNLLTGQVPAFRNSDITADSFANNRGLCGGPLESCRGKFSKRDIAVIAGAAVGGVTVAALGWGIVMFFVRRVSLKKKEEDPEGNR